PDDPGKQATRMAQRIPRDGDGWEARGSLGWRAWTAESSAPLCPFSLLTKERNEEKGKAVLKIPQSKPPIDAGISRPPKLPFQIVLREQQRRRPAVWAVVVVIRQVTLRQQLVHLLRVQPLAGADRGVAGHQTEQVVEQHIARRQPVL